MNLSCTCFRTCHDHAFGKIRIFLSKTCSWQTPSDSLWVITATESLKRTYYPHFLISADRCNAMFGSCHPISYAVCLWHACIATKQLKQRSRGSHCEEFNALLMCMGSFMTKVGDDAIFRFHNAISRKQREIELRSSCEIIYWLFTGFTGTKFDDLE